MSKKEPMHNLTINSQGDYNIPKFDVVTNQSYDFSLSITNCRSVCNKWPELEVLIDFHKFDFVFGTESHLDDSVLNAEVFPLYYTIYR